MRKARHTNRHSDQERHAEMHRHQSLQMNNILFYVVYSNHTEFVAFLSMQMITNIKKEYKCFNNTHKALCRLETMLQSATLSHMHCVVVFFFFLTIDPKMRHWILNSQLSTHENTIRDALVRRNVDLIPGGAGQLKRNKCNNNPFLGQLVAFEALNPHVAVPIFTTIMHEGFFQPMFTSQDPESISNVFNSLKALVMFA